MTWIKIDEDVYAELPTPDPARIISISELEGEIAELKSRVKLVPDNDTLEFYLEHHPEQIHLRVSLEKKEQLMGEMTGG